MTGDNVSHVMEDDFQSSDNQSEIISDKQSVIFSDIQSDKFFG